MVEPGGDVRALLFDVFGTVVDWRSGIVREAAPFLSRHRVDADPYAFADAWRGRYRPALGRDPGRRGLADVQAAAGGVPPHGRRPRAPACRVHDGRRP